MGILDYKKRESRIKPKLSLQQETRKTIKMLIVTLSGMILVLAIAFLSTTSKGAEQGYTLEQQKLKNEQLKNENESLEAKINQETALIDLKSNKKINVMTTPEQKTFVDKKDNSVK